MLLNRLITPSWPRKRTTALEYSKARGGRALVIMIAGVLTLVDYHNGFVSTQTHDVASWTKSLSGVIAEQLIRDTVGGPMFVGGPTSLDSLVSDVLTEWQVPGARGTMTLRQLLCLTGGCIGDDEDDPAGQWTYQQNVDLANVPNAAVGIFQYGRVPFLIFAAYCNRLLNANGYPGVTAVTDYLDEILAPHSASISSWDVIPASGEPKMQAGAHITAMAGANFGEYLRTSEPAIAELSGPGPDYDAYGVTLWRSLDRPFLTLNGDGTANFPGGGYMAAGRGKSRLIILPDMEMVCARFGEVADPEEDPPLWSDIEFVNLLRGGHFS